MGNQSLVPQNNNESKGALISKFAMKFGVDQNQLAGILKSTCFKLPQKKGEAPAEVSNEQMAALLIVADQYGLNPFTKEIYAFPDKGKGIVPIVGVDGWTRIMNEHPQFDGIEFVYSDETMAVDEDAKPCPTWIEAVVYRKDRSRPTRVREYLAECYRPAFVGSYGKTLGPWQSHTNRFLRHKALIQGVRVAFGFSGIYEEDEAERIANARVVNMNHDMHKAIDTEPVPQSSAQKEPSKRQTNSPDPVNDFFDGDPDPEQETPQIDDEESVALVALGEMFKEYQPANAAARKSLINRFLSAQGVNLSDMERLVGKTFAQWTKKDRIALLTAGTELSLGTDPAEVFPIK